MYSCRPAVPADYPAICSLPQTEEELYFMFPSAAYPLTPEQLDAAVRMRWRPTVVTIDGVIVGFANFYGWEEGRHCHLGNVIVAAEHRGTEAAGCLIRTMIGKARDELNVPRLLLVCHHTNPRAMLFYDKLGFVPYGIKRMKNRQGETIVGILMEMALASGDDGQK
ncbi:GNAT family N-acetyltransferase [Paenibacillus sp. GCM10012303]|uniref:GNAT family N-acetyltransferase n=1 Tax=Paenibacillus sp. GCM10012303 TaxID=3317340 RepID=UPI0036191B48